MSRSPCVFHTEKATRAIDVMLRIAHPEAGKELQASLSQVREWLVDYFSFIGLESDDSVKVFPNNYFEKKGNWSSKFYRQGKKFL